MFAVADIIEHQANAWAHEQRENASSMSGAIFRHIDQTGKLRKPQRQAIETYLWLKFVGGGKPLAQIIADGKLTGQHLAKQYGYNDCWQPNLPARDFFLAFATGNKLKALETKAREEPGHDWQGDLENLLGAFPYPNRIFSLPMGAGKTYLMAAFICLDLHFSCMLPDDKRFAHNFIVLAPHAAKTAILPSLKTIKNFNPAWVLPPSTAAEVSREMRVEVLDQPSAAKGSMRVNNPNLEKVNRLSRICRRGMVFITNAEKVVLEQMTEKEKWNVTMRRKKADEAEKHNALRDCMAEIPALAVFLDEVHHAQNEDKKLRQAVAILNAKNNLREVSGFSGTPYTSAAADIAGLKIRYKQMQDTVYHFPLAHGIGAFLKTPKAMHVGDMQEGAFVKSALGAFFSGYDSEYPGGAKSKIAFYCPSIKALNENYFPAVREWYAKNRPGRENEILSYYTNGGADYPLQPGALAEFHNLDSPHSEKRVVLLVAVGREGWDCRSLTAVAIPRKKTTRNFVLQTSCRCMREVEKGANESALICLGDGNYQLLAEQLQKTHNITVSMLEKGESSDDLPILKRKPQLGKLNYKQISHRWTMVSKKAEANPREQLKRYKLSGFAARNKYAAVVTTGKITSRGKIGGEVRKDNTAEAQKKAAAEFLSPVETFSGFLVELQQALWGRLTAAELSQQHGAELRRIHEEFTKKMPWFAAHPHGGKQKTIEAMREVAALFAAEPEYRADEILENTEIELLEWTDGKNFIAWGNGNFLPDVDKNHLHRYHATPSRFGDDLKDDGIDPQDISFNYAPYRLDSGFEREMLLEMLKEDGFGGFELYYNGYTGSDSLQSFYISTPTGRYSPDFLLLQRKNGQKYREGADKQAAIERVLIIETKGVPYDDDAFRAKEKFVRQCFLKKNRQFEYLCLRDDGNIKVGDHLDKLRQKVRTWQNNGDRKNQK